jgi:hypothetical protein
MKKGIACILLSLLFILPQASGIAADRPEYIVVKNIPLGIALGTKDEWSAAAYQIKETDTVLLEMTALPSRLCFNPLNDSGTRQCFDAKDGNEAYPIFEELKLITIRESGSPKSGVLFVTEARGKVEPTRLITIWTYHSSSGTFHNLLPTVRINLQGEYLIIPKMKEGVEGILITASRIWNGERESLYGHHKYTIKIYVQSDKGKYVLKSQYVTRKSYPGLDDTEKIDVITNEMKYISSRLVTMQQKSL